MSDVANKDIIVLECDDFMPRTIVQRFGPVPPTMVGQILAVAIELAEKRSERAVACWFENDELCVEIETSGLLLKARPE